MSTFVIVRSQHSNGSSANMFSGPDCYVAVADISYPVAALREKVDFVCTGEGYSENSGPRSGLGKAIAKAIARAEKAADWDGNIWASAGIARKIEGNWPNALAIR